jgi:hypothetical protein
MSTTNKITIKKGVPYVGTFTITYKVSHLPYNLTGKTLFFTVKELTDYDETDSSALIQKDVSVHTDAVNGITVVSLDKTETDVEVGIYKWDIKIYGQESSGEALDDFNTSTGECEVKYVVTQRRA